MQKEKNGNKQVGVKGQIILFQAALLAKLLGLPQNGEEEEDNHAGED